MIMKSKGLICLFLLTLLQLQLVLNTQTKLLALNGLKIQQQQWDWESESCSTKINGNQIDNTGLVISYVQSPLQDGTSWQIEIKTHSLEGHICFGVFPYDQLQALLQFPDDSHKYESIIACTDQYYNNIEGDIEKQGDIPLRQPGIFTLDFSIGNLEIQNEDASFYSNFLLSNNREYIPFIEIFYPSSLVINPQEGGPIEGFPVPVTEEEAEPEEEFEPIQVGNWIWISYSQHVTIDYDFIQVNDQDHFPQVFVDTFLNNEQIWTVKINQASDQGYICFGVISEDQRQSIQRHADTTHRQSSASVCTDKHLNYQENYLTYTSEMPTGSNAAGLYFEVIYLRDKLIITDKNYQQTFNAVIVLDETKNYYPWFELHNVPNSVLATAQFSYIPYNFEWVAPVSQIYVSQEDKKIETTQQEIVQTIVSQDPLTTHISWVIQIKEHSETAYLCFGVLDHQQYQYVQENPQISQRENAAVACTDDQYFNAYGIIDFITEREAMPLRKKSEYHNFILTIKLVQEQQSSLVNLIQIDQSIDNTYWELEIKELVLDDDLNEHEHFQAFFKLSNDKVYVPYIELFDFNTIYATFGVQNPDQVPSLVYVPRPTEPVTVSDIPDPIERVRVPIDLIITEPISLEYPGIVHQTEDEENTISTVLDRNYLHGHVVWWVTVIDFDLQKNSWLSLGVIREQGISQVLSLPHNDYTTNQDVATITTSGIVTNNHGSVEYGQAFRPPSVAWRYRFQYYDNTLEIFSEAENQYEYFYLDQSATYFIIAQMQGQTTIQITDMEELIYQFPLPPALPEPTPEVLEEEESIPDDPKWVPLSEASINYWPNTVLTHATGDSSYAIAYYNAKVQPQTEWYIFVQNHDFLGEVCFGLLPITNLEQISTENLQDSSIGVCTDQTYFNIYDSKIYKNKIGEIKYRDANSYITYHFTYDGAYLYIEELIDSQDRFQIKMPVERVGEYLPFMTVNYQSQLVTYAVSYTPRDVPVEEVVVDEETPVIDEPTLDVLEERVANFWEWKTYSENIIIQDQKYISNPFSDLTGNSYANQKLCTIETFWEVVVLKHSEQGWICFGLIPYSQFYLLQERKDKSLYANIAGVCTNGYMGNPYGSMTFENSIKIGQQSLGARFRLRYYQENENQQTLAIEDLDGTFSTKFYFENTSCYVPYVELQSDDDVMVSQPIEVIIPEVQPPSIPISIPNDWNWYSQSWSSVIKGTHLICDVNQSTPSEFYVDTILTEGTQWQVYVQDHQYIGWVCVGVFPAFIQTGLVVYPNNYHYYEAAVACTDNTYYNPYGTVDHNTIPYMRESIGVTFTITYYKDSLQIKANNQNAFAATFYLDKTAQYIPYVEIFQNNHVVVTAKDVEVVKDKEIIPQEEEEEEEVIIEPTPTVEVVDEEEEKQYEEETPTVEVVEEEEQVEETQTIPTQPPVVEEEEETQIIPTEPPVVQEEEEETQTIPTEPPVVDDEEEQQEETIEPIPTPTEEPLSADVVEEEEEIIEPLITQEEIEEEEIEKVDTTIIRSGEVDDIDHSQDQQPTQQTSPDSIPQSGIQEESIADEEEDNHSAQIVKDEEGPPISATLVSDEEEGPPISVTIVTDEEEVEEAVEEEIQEETIIEEVEEEEELQEETVIDVVEEDEGLQEEIIIDVVEEEEEIQEETIIIEEEDVTPTQEPPVVVQEEEEITIEEVEEVEEEEEIVVVVEEEEIIDVVDEEEQQEEEIVVVVEEEELQEEVKEPPTTPTVQEPIIVPGEKICYKWESKSQFAIMEETSLENISQDYPIEAYVDYEMKQGESFQVTIQNYSDSGYISIGLYPKDQLDQLISDPDSAHYSQGLNYCNDGSAYNPFDNQNYSFEQGNFVYGTDSIGQTFTVNYTKSVVTIDNLASGGNMIIKFNIQNENQILVPWIEIYQPNKVELAPFCQTSYTIIYPTPTVPVQEEEEEQEETIEPTVTVPVDEEDEEEEEVEEFIQPTLPVDEEGEPEEEIIEPIVDEEEEEQEEIIVPTVEQEEEIIEPIVQEEEEEEEEEEVITPIEPEPTEPTVVVEEEQEEEEEEQIPSVYEPEITQIDSLRWDWISYSDCSDIQGNLISCNQSYKYSQSYQPKQLLPGTSWNIFIVSHSNNGWICFGVISHVYEDSLYYQANGPRYADTASLCTDVSFYNAYGGIDRTGTIEPKQSGKIYSLTYYPGQLYITNSDQSIEVSFQLDARYEYLPWIEIHDTSIVSVTPLNSGNMFSQVPSNPNDWEWVTHSDEGIADNLLDFVKTTQQESVGIFYVNSILTENSTWEITIDELPQPGWICFGIYEALSSVALQQYPNNFHYGSSVSVCTDMTYYNKYGLIDINQEIMAQVGQKYDITFVENQLIITSQYGFIAKLDVPIQYMFIPFVEIYRYGKVSIGAVTIPEIPVVDIPIPEEISQRLCVQVYSECDYLGESAQICENDAQFAFNYAIKSIYLPEGKSLTLFNVESCFGGNMSTFSQSVDCLDDLQNITEFTQLKQHGIMLLQKGQTKTKSNLIRNSKSQKSTPTSKVEDHDSLIEQKKLQNKYKPQTLEGMKSFKAICSK